MALKLSLPITSFSFSSYKLSSKSHNLRKHVTAGMASTAKEVKPFLPPGTQVHQVTHSMAPEKIEIFESLEKWAEENLLVHLKPVEKCWQPQDFLPDPESEEFYEQVRELRERAKDLPDDYFVVLVGHMITEEALPTYLSLLNTFDGTRDLTGASLTSWAIWSRAWAAEENRHGDLLNKYLYLTGRVDMRQIEKTIQYLIGTGMDPKIENNPFRGFIYTAFQERATFINHGNAARIAKGHGDLKLAQICGTIAADEKRHETAYTKVMEKLFEMEPDDCVVSFADLMKERVSMPSNLMFDGRDENLYGHLANVVERLGVYTTSDYADITDVLVDKWKVDKLTGLSAQGREAQDYVCGLSRKIRSLAERARENAEQAPTAPFSWIFGKHV